MLAIIGVVALVVLVLLSEGEITFDIGDDGSSLPTVRPVPTGTVTRGEPAVIASGTAAPNRETAITAPVGGPAAGLRLTIPAGAYPIGTGFTVSASPIDASGFGGLVTPVSDLVTVENGGGYAATPVLVTVPVTVPDGSVAMGVYLHDDGTLEPMPLVDATPTAITLVTRHFSSFFVTVIAEAALPEEIGTGFRAGEDDIQTPNHGSYIEPGGHCAGQSLVALWYFSERTSAGARSLNGLLGNRGRDETPGFWPDDRLAYRLSSSVSRDLDWYTLSGTLELAFEKAKVDRLQWNVFRYAMLLTGQPQFVGLSEGDEPGGHVIIAYAATRTGLWVADPNFPGKLRDIAWNAGTAQFDSYASGANAADSKHLYDRIAFYGKTALVEWDRIGQRWAEADAGTTGDDRFPASSLSVAVQQPDGTATWAPLVDGTIVTRPWIRIGFAGTAGMPITARVYRGETALVDIPSPGNAVVTLEPGLNRLGFFILAPVGKDLEAVDFVYVTVIGPGTASPTETVATGDPTEAPTDAPATTPEPVPNADCTGTPPAGGIKRLEWELKCGDGVISTAPP